MPTVQNDGVIYYYAVWTKNEL